jgi:hypothetical protein
MAEETEERAPDVWSRDRLTGKSVSFKGIPAETETNGTSHAPLSPRQKRKSKVKLDIKLDPMLWGQPGHLTEEEADVYVSGQFVSFNRNQAIRWNASLMSSFRGHRMGIAILGCSGCGEFSIDWRVRSWLLQ